MSSRDALLSRIDDICSAIEHEKNIIEPEMNVLNNLITSLSDTRGQLNTLAPVARLPPEILSHIFKFCNQPLHDNHILAAPSRTPLLLLGVCRLWRDIVLSCPLLWTSVCFNAHPGGTNYAKLVSAWLGRSRALPLDIWLSGSVLESSQKALEEHASRVRKLEITGSLQGGKSYLVHMMKTSFLSLRTLNLYGRRNCTISDYLRILQSAPLLTELGLGLYRSFYQTGGWLASVVHTALRTLKLIQKDIYICPSFILSYMTLPALESLTLARRVDKYSSTDGHLSEFFSRSSPPLTHLDISYLRLVPSLADLEMDCDGGFDAPATVCARMASDLDLVPGLRSLRVKNLGFSISYGEFSRSQLLPPLLLNFSRLRPLLECVRFDYHSYDAPLEVRWQLQGVTTRRGGALHVHEGNRAPCLCSRCQ
ncbi:hypothetical protein R3P38DRAFT_2872030 [Favolaschia claudopus]|uniref:F-box domain-containing protein n=1 Tax=Favolaschia claudopus TaxID=2862362 RepID=A0AAW0D8T5_9AGAR